MVRQFYVLSKTRLYIDKNERRLSFDEMPESYIEVNQYQIGSLIVK
jgi:hypothetical protein